MSVNFDQELEKRKKILDGEKETITNKLSLKYFCWYWFFQYRWGQNSIRLMQEQLSNCLKIQIIT